MNDDTDSNKPELAALQWFEQMQARDIGEATFDGHRRWLETPANAEAYRKVEGVFALIRTLADSPEIAILSEETNRRILNQPIEGGARISQQNPNSTVNPPSEKPK